MASEVLPLAIAAAFFPAGLIVFTLLVTREPFRLRAVCFLAGAMVMTFACGIALVELAQSTDLAGGGGDHERSGLVDLAIGVLLLTGAMILYRRPPSESKGPSERTQRLMRSPALAFVLGAAMYAPSPLYMGSLKGVADAGLSHGANLAWVGFLTIVVTSMIEIPVVLMLVRPERGRAVLARVNGWLAANGRTVGMWALFLAGGYLLLRGLVRVA